MTVWTDPGQCSSCKYCGMDMDMDPYCTHPKAMKKSPSFGLGINAAIREFCSSKLKFREERK